LVIARRVKSATLTTTTVRAVHCEPVSGPKRLSIRRKSSRRRAQPYQIANANVAVPSRRGSRMNHQRNPNNAHAINMSYIAV
jgi:hypothetical protein